MASDGRHELVRGALIAVQVVLLTQTKRRRVRILPEWALDFDVLEDMETTEKEEGEYCDGSRVKRTRQAHPRSGVCHAPWSIILRKAQLKRHDSREIRYFFRRFHIAYEFFLEIVKMAKQRKLFSLTARDVAGRQCIPVDLKISTTSYC